MRSANIKLLTAAATITFTSASFPSGTEVSAQPREFTAECNYMSREGYLRWQYLINNNVWINLVNKNRWMTSRGETIWLKHQQDKNDAIVELSSALSRFPSNRYFSIEYSPYGDAYGVMFYDRLRADLAFGSRRLETTSEHGMMMGPVEFYTSEKANDHDIMSKAAAIQDKRK